MVKIVLKNKAYLILTVDYEIFGNGLGCVDRCVIVPAGRMMRITKRFNAPVTFFVEATEFMAMQVAGVPAVDRVRQQLAQSVFQGHDVQLHLHPQWENAHQEADGSWRVDNEIWRIGDLPFDTTLRILKAGKAWLECVAGEKVPEYCCFAFRAGGWCIQPSQRVVRAMMGLGFQIDSTVAPGLRNETRVEWSDFRKAPVKPYWKIDGNVCKEASSGLLEVPIVTGKIGRWRHLEAVRTARSTGEGGLASGCMGDYHRPGGRLESLQGKIGKVMHLGHVMLDFSTMPVDILIEITRQWIARFGGNAIPVPLVAIAHTKNFTEASDKNMAEYLAWVKNERIVFSTYGEWLNAMDG